MFYFFYFYRYKYHWWMDKERSTGTSCLGGRFEVLDILFCQSDRRNFSWLWPKFNHRDRTNIGRLWVIFFPNYIYVQFTFTIIFSRLCWCSIHIYNNLFENQFTFTMWILKNLKNLTPNHHNCNLNINNTFVIFDFFFQPFSTTTNTNIIQFFIFY